MNQEQPSTTEAAHSVNGAKSDVEPIVDTSHDDRRPVIHLADERHHITARAASIVAGDPDLYSMDGRLVRVKDDGESSAAVTVVTASQLQNVLSRAAVWLDRRGHTAHPPKWVAAALVEVDACDGIRALNRSIDPLTARLRNSCELGQ